VGVVRRDPMAMLPFMGYHVGDYLAHWIDIGKAADSVKLPKIFYVNWFRRDEDNKFVWPGFRENIRVLKWAIDRIEGTAPADETAIGRVPTVGGLDVDGLDLSSEDLQVALNVETAEWRNEIPGIEEWFDKIGNKLPTSMRDELESLKLRLNA
jgi:phosphoenolpyruvate carboxykinase (GTP)